MAKIEVDSYSVKITCGQNIPARRAKIDLYLGSKLAGAISFKDQIMPTDQDNITGGTINMFLPIDMCAAVLEVLRHEKPVYVDFDDKEKRGVLLANGGIVGK